MDHHESTFASAQVLLFHMYSGRAGRIELRLYRDDTIRVVWLRSDQPLGSESSLTVVDKEGSIYDDRLVAAIHEYIGIREGRTELQCELIKIYDELKKLRRGKQS